MSQVQSFGSFTWPTRPGPSTLRPSTRNLPTTTDGTEIPELRLVAVGYIRHAPRRRWHRLGPRWDRRRAPAPKLAAPIAPTTRLGSRAREVVGRLFFSLP